MLHKGDDAQVRAGLGLGGVEVPMRDLYKLDTMLPVRRYKTYDL